MNSSQLLAVLVCVLFALVCSAPVESLKPEEEVAPYADDRWMEKLAAQGYPLYDSEDGVPLQPMDKRAQTFVRFGKRAQTFVRFGKRAQTFVRFG